MGRYSDRIGRAGCEHSTLERSSDDHGIVLKRKGSGGKREVDGERWRRQSGADDGNDRRAGDGGDGARVEVGPIWLTT